MDAAPFLINEIMEVAISHSTRPMPLTQLSRIYSEFLGDASTCYYDRSATQLSVYHHTGGSYVNSLPVRGQRCYCFPIKVGGIDEHPMIWVGCLWGAVSSKR
jgi:hypothetical protein